jgi:cobyrinic acid a,c-diamide synthase
LNKELASGLIIAAPASGSGKTVVTLSLLRALKNSGGRVGSFKIGPDYIDPAYHSAASGAVCRNLDFWGMRESTLMLQLDGTVVQNSLVITEGVMGLFDGAATGHAMSSGSTADAAKWLGWPVILVVDAKGQGASAAALVEGFVNHRDDIKIAGIIFNRIGGLGHEHILRDAISHIGIPCLGCIPRDARLDLPTRHLGLVQAKEILKLNLWLDEAANVIAAHVDLELVSSIAEQSKVITISDIQPPISKLGQHTAIACDDAFAFCYDHIVDAWRAAGAELSFFSPLAGEIPDASADSVYLPGGYPELHGAAISSNSRFVEAMHLAVAKGVVIYGECGGFMVLGEMLTDREGKSHEMLGLLPVNTSFQEPRLHLGYRNLTLKGAGPLGKAGSQFKGHEFHYCSVTKIGDADSLFHARDAKGECLPEMGCKVGNVMGSFAHIIDSV